MDDLADRILFIDGEALVLDKPAGLAVHAGPSTRSSLEDGLDDLRFGFVRPPSPVHRLDRDTSGCLLLARNYKAHRRFSRAFEAGEAIKTYVAWLAGPVAAKGGRIDLPLAKRSSRESGWRMVADPAGQGAVTLWRKAGEADGRAFVVFRPLTGRTHQLRLHAAEGLGAPIAGDPVYGEGKEGRLMLHAWALELPRGGKPSIKARAPLPAPFREAGLADEQAEQAIAALDLEARS